ncbi:MAG: phytoene/squalene synthase family protein [Spirulinaceae cyanobacterium]
MSLHKGALEILKATSRTFYIPISRLPLPLQKAVASAYLCMRAIDEIEDHPGLNNALKAKLLRTISLNLQGAVEDSQQEDFSVGLLDEQNQLEEVTLRIGEWVLLAPETIAPRIWEATATMADRMAYWADCNWQINTKADLDRYTFSVAGSVGLLLSDLWAWYDGTQTNRLQSVGFGRGLQAVNILRNHSEDIKRGVDFFPEGWETQQIHQYARHNLALADAYTNALPAGPAWDFCKIPLTLAHGTLSALAVGKEKLSRRDVMSLIEKVMTVSK